MAITSWGQTAAHRLQPLHRSWSIIIVPLVIKRPLFSALAIFLPYRRGTEGHSTTRHIFNGQVQFLFFKGKFPNFLKLWICQAKRLIFFGVWKFLFLLFSPETFYHPFHVKRAIADNGNWATRKNAPIDYPAITRIITSNFI